MHEFNREAKQYFKEHGDLRVPTKYKAPNGYALDEWVRSQREKKAGRISKSRHERIGTKKMYRKIIKPILDITLSLLSLILFSWLFLIIIIAIEIDDPGPVFFTQKRVGIHKKYFKLYKFRSMKMSTPHDTPTHLLENPDQYITKVGRVLRKLSLDETPQLINILKQDMSIIGPRPALWNQYDLIEERDKYGANDIKPGLSGWAQINGRDELEIADKARLDGEYVKRMSFLFDCRCFFGTAVSALRHDGVVEGGTGELHKMESKK